MLALTVLIAIGSSIRKLSTRHSWTVIPMAKLRFDPQKTFDDPREMPAYSIPLAAHYLRIPASTLRAWVHGRKYATEGGYKSAAPVINLPDPDRPLLSFVNLAEAHTLRVFRKDKNIKLHHIRAAIDYVTKKTGKEHPLVQQDFRTDGARLLVDELGRIVDASGFGQTVMPQMLEHLERLDFDSQGAARLYPFMRHDTPGPKAVFIDPRYSFGRPVLASVFITTTVIADRYEAGESVSDLADDYGCERLDIEEAIRCEFNRLAA